MRLKALVYPFGELAWLLTSQHYAKVGGEGKREDGPGPWMKYVGERPQIQTTPELSGLESASP